MNHTVFHIDGGAGRVIAAIPALLKVHKNNPNDDFKELHFLLWSQIVFMERIFLIQPTVERCSGSTSSGSLATPRFTSWRFRSLESQLKSCQYLAANQSSDIKV
mgnify:CR=1 FL=1